MPRAGEVVLMLGAVLSTDRGSEEKQQRAGAESNMNSSEISDVCLLGPLSPIKRSDADPPSPSAVTWRGSEVTSSLCFPLQLQRVSGDDVTPQRRAGPAFVTWTGPMAPW
ncbi:hypothetical protein NDU88_010884 [Pleurodeles waltl]|uniref:Secreted protein n=1 Tax=Pleurodeles waltl TaxID=8319 RepID=A0AAV7S1X5_PLEWA|nr:hypothetical protein NDU88_010884 [Pleurodeles waltl]